MARIKKVKEAKIIREFVNSRFKEIKPEEAEEEQFEENEEEPEKQESDEFQDFSQSQRAAPVLRASESSQASQSSLEATAETAPSTSPEPGKEDNLYEAKYSEGDYSNEKYSDMENETSRTIMAERFQPQEPFQLNPAKEFSPKKMTQQWEFTQNNWAQIERREERKYEAIEEKVKEEKKLQAERRRRVRD